MTSTSSPAPTATSAPATGTFAALAPWTYTLLRVGAALLFMEHGAQKLFGWFGGVGGTPGQTAPLVSQFGLAGILEFGGGLLMVLGLFTRPVALLLAGEMTVAFFQAHLPRGVIPIVNGGELAVLYLLVWLFFLTHGAGPLSLDARRGAGRL